MSVLERVSAAKSIYFLPKDDLLSVLVPSIASSSSLDCMIGFFGSSSFAEIAPGLASYLRQSNQPMRLLISPFVKEDDQEAMKLGVATPDAVGERYFIQSLPDADALAQHTLACLAWLIKEHRLQIKIAVMSSGLFHPKVWLLNLDGHRLAFHGSGNLTRSGLRRNKEQIALARSWMDAVQRETEDRLREEFNILWHDDDGDCKVLSLSKAVEEKLLRDYGTTARPEEEECARLWRKANGITEAELPDDEEQPEVRLNFHIPSWLEYRAGPFAHQGRAVDAWLAAGGRGVLAMATGSGKTLTSLIASWHLSQTIGPVIIVVAAPYVPLIMQWSSEIELFGLRARNLSDGRGPAERRKAIREAARNLTLGLSTAEALIVSHDILCDPEFRIELSNVEAARILIADEMHNLGSPSFLNSAPTYFEYRLGLSATPRRQYDPEGTDKLFEFFGDICFEFSLEDAIGVCLVPYDYYVHLVELNTDEMDEFIQLTNEIRKLGWKLEQGIPDAKLDDLIRRRRLVIEKAAGKIAALGDVLSKTDPRELRYELVYCTDKAPPQLDSVNALLRQRGVLYHQLTYEETGNRKATARILSAFQQGELQVLTAKRVLDEGVNIPQIKRAFILASTTVERQWVQRRGRLLRKCDAIGKTHGVIHDFVAMPPNAYMGDPDGRKLIATELRRVEEFARLARNYGAEDGPLRALEKMQEVVYALGE